MELQQISKEIIEEIKNVKGNKKLKQYKDDKQI